MKKSIFLGALMLSALAWAGAQQPNSMPAQSDAQAPTPNSQVPSSGEPQPATPGGAEQNAPQAGPQSGAPGQAANAPVTEGCLGGSNPNYTITDSGGKTYKLVLPPNADGSRLAPHIGESVQVMGDLKQGGGANSIDVSKVGKGAGKCSGK
jgi:hypothetical protein